MKLLFVSSMDDAPWGGSEELWSRTALRLAAVGHAVFASVRAWPSPHRRIGEMRHVGVAVHERVPEPWLLRILRERILGRSLRQASRGLRRTPFERLLDEIRPDLVCVSQGNVLDGVGFLESCLHRDIPSVILSHGNATHLWPGDPLADRLLRVYESARATYFVSSANRRLLEDQLGVELPRAVIVQNPSNVEWSNELSWPASDAPLRLACVGRLEPGSKAQDLLLHVLAAPEWRQRPIVVNLFGTGPMERSLKRLAQRLAVEDRVRFCGQVDDVASIWRSHHALVLPSRHEGLPLVVCEAMLCARPCISTRTAGIPEMVEDGVTGFLADAPPLPLFAAAMERAWERRHEWRAMGEHARQVARAKLSRDPAGDFAARLLRVAAQH